MVITKSLFHPYFAGLILCAILAATISTIDSQIIVLASVLAEDIYKKIFNTDASDKAVLFASRFFVIIIALFALLMAAARPASIFKIVEYAWFGLGSAFGPALLYSLYSKNITKQAALWGILTGGIVSALWLTLNTNISAMFPGAGLSFLVMFILTKSTINRFQD